MLEDASWTLSVWKYASISVEGVRWIIDGMSVASVVMDVPRCILWLCRDDTRSKWQDGRRSKAKVGSMQLCTCVPVGSGVVEDTRENALENAHPGSGENTLVMDGTRVKVPPFVMRGFAHSCRCMVLQRAARGVLGCSLLDDDEPVRTKRGPTPLRRSIGAMSCLSLDVFPNSLVPSSTNGGYVW